MTQELATIEQTALTPAEFEKELFDAHDETGGVSGQVVHWVSCKERNRFKVG